MGDLDADRQASQSPSGRSEKWLSSKGMGTPEVEKIHAHTKYLCCDLSEALDLSDSKG